MKRRRNKTYHDNCAKQALMRKIRHTLRQYYKLAIFTFSAFILFTSIWVMKDDSTQTVAGVITGKIYKATADAGLKLERVKFEGDKYLGQAELVEELGLLEGTPILALDLDNLRAEIKKKNWVKEAEIRRELPSELRIKITEREPIAIWQYKQQLSLIDDEGVVLTGLDSADGLPFPLIVGEGANKDAKHIFSLLETQKMLYDRVQAAVRLGDRRWNIVFMNGIEVMLPEENAEDAWKKLARMQIERQILDRDIKAIDFRLPDRVYIRTLQGKIIEKSRGDNV